jgi:hypothetical protein
MEKNMQGIQPQTLTDAELAKYAYLQGAKGLSPEWVTELITRFESLLMDYERLEAKLEAIL